MRTVASTLVALGAVAGIGGAAFAYQSAAAPDEVVTRSVSDEPDPTPSTEVRYLPCKAGTTLRAGVCVREVEKVVVRDLPAPATRTPVRTQTRSSDDGPDATPAPSPTSSVRDDDERDDHEADEQEFEHESEHGDEHETEHGDEHESEHHGDDD